MKRGDVKIRIPVIISTYESQCGIGTFTRAVQLSRDEKFYIISETPKAKSYLDENIRVYIDPLQNNGRLLANFANSLYPDRAVFSIMHTFGINPTSILLEDIEYLSKHSSAEIILIPHTLYSQRTSEPEGTLWGMRSEEEDFFSQLLQFDNVKAVAAFSDCTYHALAVRYPGKINRFTVVRHGVHDYSWLNREVAKRVVLQYVKRTNPEQAEKFAKMIYDPDVRIFGSVGFVNPDRAKVFELGGKVNGKARGTIYTMHMGDLHPSALTTDTNEAKESLAKMIEYGEERENIFIQVHVEDDIFPYVMAIPNLFYAVNFKITQSGRSCHWLGLKRNSIDGLENLDDSYIMVPDVEGEGETFKKMIGLRSARDERDMPDVALSLLNMNTATRRVVDRNLAKYGADFDFSNQADKYDILARWDRRSKIPTLDTGASEEFGITGRPLEGIVAREPLPKISRAALVG